MPWSNVVALVVFFVFVYAIARLFAPIIAEDFKPSQPLPPEEPTWKMNVPERGRDGR